MQKAALACGLYKNRQWPVLPMGHSLLTSAKKLQGVIRNICSLKRKKKEHEINSATSEFKFIKNTTLILVKYSGSDSLLQS